MKRKYLISILLILVGGIIGNILRFTERQPEQPPDFDLIPFNYADYTGTNLVLAEFAVETLKANRITMRDYVSPDGGHVEFFLAYFKSQKYGSQIHSPKHCLPGGGWRIDQIEPYRLRLPDGQLKNVNRLSISAKNRKSLMLYWFETRSGEIRSEYGLKLDLVKNSLFFRPTDAAIIRVTVDATDGDFDKAARRAEDFLRYFYPSIAKSLPF